jgi:hypothetical protein
MHELFQRKPSALPRPSVDVAGGSGGRRGVRSDPVLGLRAGSRPRNDRGATPMERSSTIDGRSDRAIDRQDDLPPGRGGPPAMPVVPITTHGPDPVGPGGAGARVFSYPALCRPWSRGRFTPAVRPGADLPSLPGRRRAIPLVVARRRLSPLSDGASRPAIRRLGSLVALVIVLIVPARPATAPASTAASDPAVHAVAATVSREVPLHDGEVALAVAVLLAVGGCVGGVPARRRVVAPALIDSSERRPTRW